jgi:hypothetical protein
MGVSKGQGKCAVYGIMTLDPSEVKGMDGQAVRMRELKV